MDLFKKVKTIRLAIHRGEEIIFNYRLKSGKVIVGRTTKPIDYDTRMTMYGLDDWNGLCGTENAYKIAFMSEIERKTVSEGFISDQYDPNRSLLKGKAFRPVERINIRHT